MQTASCAVRATYCWMKAWQPEAHKTSSPRFTIGFPGQCFTFITLINTVKLKLHMSRVNTHKALLQMICAQVFKIDGQIHTDSLQIYNTRNSQVFQPLIVHINLIMHLATDIGTFSCMCLGQWHARVSMRRKLNRNKIKNKTTVPKIKV